MQDIREISMIVGHHFNSLVDKYNDLDEWSASEECATVAEIVYNMVKYLQISPESATDEVIKNITSFGFREVKDHAWDEYVRGFIAGQIIGLPTEKNLKLLERAEGLWDSDHKGKYGYFQEVCQEVVTISIPMISIVVREGMVQSVYVDTDDINAMVEVLDLDMSDFMDEEEEKEYEKIVSRVNEIVNNEDDYKEIW